MGGLFTFGQKKKEEEIKPPTQKKAEIQKVDQVKFRLKKARDTIKNFINTKTQDIKYLQQKIAQKVPAFKETGRKKQLIPLLKAKKDIIKMLDAGQVRLKLVNEKLDEVQMQKINAQTINVLEDSNKYVREIHQILEKKDWRNVLDQAQYQYEIEFPETQPDQNDSAFQKMWAQLGGDKIANKDNKDKIANKDNKDNPQKVLEKKALKVEIASQVKPIFQKPQQLQHV